MTHPLRHRSANAPHWIATLLTAVLVLGLSLTATPSAAGRDRGAPTPEARRAGVQPGNAYMGWRTRAETRTDSAAPRARRELSRRGVRGIDVASYQGRVDWSAQLRAGKRFAYVKATEGTSYRNPYFTSQYGGAGAAGFVRGAYHFANPAGASGAAQADYFIANGGGWRRDGRTLPGVLDIEYNPYGSTCYGLTQGEMVRWVSSFTARYRARTGRAAVIYTTADWWSRCTGNSRAFRTTNPLWVARYASSPGTLPGAWPYYTFWQYSSSPIDQDLFPASYPQLRNFATGP